METERKTRLFAKLAMNKILLMSLYGTRAPTLNQFASMFGGRNSKTSPLHMAWGRCVVFRQ